MSFDGDLSDNVRAVRRAAEANEICGAFYVSRPNFEEMNFTLEELKELLWQIAVENGASHEDRLKFDEVTLKSRSFKNVLDSVRSSIPFLNQTVKGDGWGAKLMQFAWANPMMFNQESGETQDRPIIDAIFAALRARDIDYLRIRRDYRVDPVSGRSVPK